MLHSVPPVARLLLLAALVACVTPSAAVAKRRFVPREHATIQAAVAAAAKGDTIWVTRGVYRGPIEIRKPLVLFAADGPESTILDGGDSVRVLLVEGIRNGAIIGFTIRRGKAVGGGGIQCVRDTTFDIRDCRIQKNWESGVGVWASSGVSLGGCTVRENQGSGIRFNQSVGALYGCTVAENQGHEGGGLALIGSRMGILRETVFEKNRAKGSLGGGMILTEDSEATASRCTFRENYSDVSGGGLAATTGSLLNVSRCVFERNRAASSGALQADRATLNVGYSIFDQNTAAAVAAAIGVVGRKTANVNPIFANNTFYRNAVEGDGATLFFTDVSPEVRKNILVVTEDQRAVTGLKTTPRYDCNLIWDPSGGAIGALPSANTWVGDPLFCNAEKGDFKLRDLSPARRAPCGPIGALSEKAGCASFRLQPAN